MTRETADFSEFSELEWYEWVMFRNNKVPHPNDKLTLGRYLGPSTDIGTSMTAKILKDNGRIVSRTTFTISRMNYLKAQHTKPVVLNLIGKSKLSWEIVSQQRN